MNESEINSVQAIVFDYIKKNVLLYDQKKYLLSLIDDLLSSLYKIDVFNRKLFLLPAEIHRVMPDISDETQLTKSNMGDYLKVVRESINLVDECDVLVAQNIPIDDQLNISNSINKVLGRMVVVKFRTDYSLIAGVVIKVDGVVFDYSVAHYF